MSNNIEDLIYSIKEICNDYANIDGTHQEYMGIHDLSKKLHANIISLATELMEIDAMYTEKYKEYVTNVRTETQNYLDNGVFTAYNRAEGKAKAENVDLKQEVIEYERIYSRLKFFIQMASETSKDMRSFISSLKKEKDYEQYTGYAP
jgi:hypothetical protein